MASIKIKALTTVNKDKAVAVNADMIKSIIILFPNSYYRVNDLIVSVQLGSPCGILTG